YWTGHRGAPVVWAANCVGRGSAPGSDGSGERRQIRLRSLPGRACPDPGPRSRRERSDAALRSRDAGSEPILGVKKGVEEANPPQGLSTPPLPMKMSGGDLLSHTLPSAVPSAQSSLASGFGMEPGVSSTL